MVRTTFAGSWELTMAVPTPDKEFLDLTISPFTANGSPTVADDQHNPDSTFNFDTINDWLSSSTTPFTNGSATGTLSFWIFWDGTGEGRFLNQRSSTAGAIGIWYCGVSALGSITLAYEETESGNEGVNSNSSNSTLVANTWTHIAGIINLTAETCEIFKNGVEVSYSVQDNVIGTPGATLTTPGTLGVMSGNSNVGSSLAGGIISRLKFWDDTVLTDAQILEEYNNEVASVGEGFGNVDAESLLLVLG